MFEKDFYIKAKSDGLPLEAHNCAVYNTAAILNEMFHLKLDREILRYASIFHDLGKANPLFQSNMESGNFTKTCRHEFSSLLFIDSVPLCEEMRDIVAFIILTHHKSLESEEKRGFVYQYNSYSRFEENHIGNISEWGKNVQNFMAMFYNIHIEIPTRARCEEIYKEYYNKALNLQYGVSYYRGVFQMADRFSSAYPNEQERFKKLSMMFRVPDISVYQEHNANYPLSLIDSDKTKRHTIVIAPTGSGKTNATMKRCVGRIFYLLPFQASINAMFQRFKNDLGENAFIGIRHASVNNLIFVDETTKDVSKFFGTSVMVATPFQVLRPIHKLKDYEITEIDLRGQDVILDEIHTYAGLTQAHVIEFIRYLVSINCRIHICTATIPSKLLNCILEILGKDKTQIMKLDDRALDTFNRHIIHTSENFDGVEHDIFSRYDNGEKVLIVRNQVSLAQDVYRKIKQMRPDAKILLIHSRFERWRRAEIEDMLMKYNSSDSGCIVVSTQVVEVSLDINFDVMFTDCAGIKSLIQRFGRINRQRKNIGVLRDVFVVANTDSTCLPYDSVECARTFEVMKEYDGKVLPERDIQKIIDKVDCDGDVKKITAPTEWKMFSNNINVSISEAMEFKGYVGVLEKNVDEYMETGDQGYEIPIANNRGYKKLTDRDDETRVIIQKNDYDDEYGLRVR